MKKLLLLSAFIGLSMFASAQSTDFHAFKFDIGVGYGVPTDGDGSGTKEGVTFTLQPHYRLSDSFALGVRIEAAVVGYDNNNNVSGTVLASGCLTGEYYLMRGGFRPFIGAGVGLFEQESGSGNIDGDSSVDLSSRTKGAGAFPEIGFEAGHLRVSVAYNIVGNNNSYAAAQIGFFFGGGRKSSAK